MRGSGGGADPAGTTVDRRGEVVCSCSRESWFGFCFFVRFFFCWEGERGTVGFCLEGRSVCILFRGRAVSGPSRPRGHLGGHFSEQSELEHNIYERQVAKMIHKKRTASV